MRATKLIFQALTLWACAIEAAMAFKPPGPEERLRAIGPIQGLPSRLVLALDPEDFQPIDPPGSGDWLAVHPEPGQTFEDFLSLVPPRPRPPRDKMYLQPLGSFSGDEGPSLELLREYAAIYYSMDVRLRDPLSLDRSEVRSRQNPLSGRRQILTTDVLGILKREAPSDAFCTLAITMEDLYPHPSWNFVFGQASIPDRVGVFSFARYDPTFYGEKRKEGHKSLLLKRACKVLVHETGHMFSLAHCIFFKCVMNGSNHLRESDARPLHFCPVCLRKIHHILGFDILERYERLLNFYLKVGFQEEAQWVQGRLKRVGRLATW